MSREIVLPKGPSSQCHESPAIEIKAIAPNRTAAPPESTLGSFLEGIRFLKNLEPEAGSFLARAGVFAITALAAGISLSKSTMAFGDVKVKQSKNQTFNIYNRSDCPAKVRLRAPLNFRVNHTQLTIPAKGSRYVTVTFTPPKKGRFSGYITISPGSRNIALSGKGVK